MAALGIVGRVPVRNLSGWIHKARPNIRCWEQSGLAMLLLGMSLISQLRPFVGVLEVQNQAIG
jgi:hypothetical protein